MAKLCSICKKPIYGRARKYCPDCKRKEHLEQMHKYYVDNTSRWQYNGEYWNNRNPNQLMGSSASLGEHRNKNFEKEQIQITKELRNLQLRDRKEHWRYDPK